MHNIQHKDRDMSWAARAMKPQILTRMMKENTSSSAEDKRKQRHTDHTDENGYFAARLYATQ